MANKDAYRSQSISEAVRKATGPRHYLMLFPKEVLHIELRVQLLRVSIQDEQLPWLRGGEDGETAQEYGVSFEADENGLELGSGDSCVT